MTNQFKALQSEQSMRLFGKKEGMTRLFMAETGKSIPVTLVSFDPHDIMQIRTVESKVNSKEKINLVRVSTGNSVKENRLNKAHKGQFEALKLAPKKKIREFKISDQALSELKELDLKPGSAYDLSFFSELKFVDVKGTSKGKGFAGYIKRHNFKSQRQTHGNSLSHRAGGSNGQNQDPGRVFKGKKMAGHMGDELVTVQNLRVVRVDLENKLLLIKGGIPGAPNGWVEIKAAIKKKAGSSHTDKV